MGLGVVLTHPRVDRGLRGAQVGKRLGLDMARFPTAGHLVSWAKYAPGVKESAGKKKGKNSTGHGNSYLARILGNAAAAAGRTGTFLGERYRRIARRRGAKKANVALGRPILVIVWVRREALSLRMEVKDRPSPCRRSGGVKLEAA